jgi:hypothetical protein
MALRIFRNGEPVKEYTATRGKIVFNEKAERAKETSLYNIKQERRGLSSE